MIIGIDASRVLEENETGVEYYSRAFLEALFKLEKAKEHQFILYSRTSLKFNLPSNFQNKVFKMPYLWTQFRLSLEMIFFPPDILFVPAHSLPLIHPKKSVVTVHDLGFKKYPAAYSFLNRLYLSFTTWFSVKTASKIIAVSKSTKEDIINYYKISSEKIKVIYLGFKKRNKTSLSNSLKHILYLGRIEKKKNLRRLIKAFKLLKKEKKLPYKFFLVGKDGFGADIIKKEAVVENNIIFFGYLKEKETDKLFSNASVLVLPSLYEGFGMTVLESFYLGIPVLASNIKSAIEIYKDAALLVNPLDINEIKDGLEKILTDENLRQNLIKNGYEVAKNFSWDRCAQKTLVLLTIND